MSRLGKLENILDNQCNVRKYSILSTVGLFGVGNYTWVKWQGYPYEQGTSMLDLEELIKALNQL